MIRGILYIAGRIFEDLFMGSKNLKKNPERGPSKFNKKHRKKYFLIQNTNLNIIKGNVIQEKSISNKESQENVSLATRAVWEARLVFMNSESLINKIEASIKCKHDTKAKFYLQILSHSILSNIE